MMLNVVMNEQFQSVSKTKHSKLKEADPRTHVEPTNRFPRQLSWQMIDVLSPLY